MSACPRWVPCDCCHSSRRVSTASTVARSSAASRARDDSRQRSTVRSNAGQHTCHDPNFANDPKTAIPCFTRALRTLYRVFTFSTVSPTEPGQATIHHCLATLPPNGAADAGAPRRTERVILTSPLRPPTTVGIRVGAGTPVTRTVRSSSWAVNAAALPGSSAAGGSRGPRASHSEIGRRKSGSRT